MTFVRRALPVVLLFGLVGAPPAPVQAACRAPQKVGSFTVQTEWSKTTYKVGEKAKVHVLVTRPGPNDPTGSGIPMPDGMPPQPAEGAYVTSFVNGAVPIVGAVGETDANGEVTIRFEIEDHLKGPQDVYTRASITRRSGLPSDCTDVVEEGAKDETPAFTVKP